MGCRSCRYERYLPWQLHIEIIWLKRCKQRAATCDRQCSAIHTMYKFARWILKWSLNYCGYLASPPVFMNLLCPAISVCERQRSVQEFSKDWKPSIQCIYLYMDLYGLYHAIPASLETKSNGPRWPRMYSSNKVATDMDLRIPEEVQAGLQCLCGCACYACSGCCEHMWAHIPCQSAYCTSQNMKMKAI